MKRRSGLRVANENLACEARPEQSRRACSQEKKSSSTEFTEHRVHRELGETSGFILIDSYPQHVGHGVAARLFVSQPTCSTQRAFSENVAVVGDVR